MACPQTETTKMTTGNNELTAMGLFRDGLDHDIKTREGRLRSHLGGLRREIDRAITSLDAEHRVPRNGIVLHRGIDIDQDCAILNEQYDTRISLNAALKNDAANADPAIHRGTEKGGAR
jgi:hypothetical protein